MKKLFVVLGVLLLAAATGLFWWKMSLRPAAVGGKDRQTFVVARGDGVKEIARKLKTSGLIRDQVAFFLLIKQMSLEKKIQAGSFKLSASMAPAEIAQKLTVGTEDVWITIPEGWRSEEIIEYLQKALPESAVQKLKITAWQTDEGKLSPETYLVPKQITPEALRQLLLDNFTKQITDQMRQDIKKANLTLDQVIIIASLVEREAQAAADRPLVASVISNRLKAGMKLDIDATVQYALGFAEQDSWWKKELTFEDLKIASPYNTYLNAGLPPGPICNPGMLTIRAVISPAQTDYLYYLSDKSGQMHYAKTLSEHNQNVAKYL